MLLAANGKKYSVLDLKEAYLKMTVEPNSRFMLTIATPIGYFRYCQLPFGVSAAPLMFQRYMEQLIADIDSHLNRLKEVLKGLQKAGMRIRGNKCIFLQQVSFLDHILDNNSIRPSNERIKAIQNMKTPTNARELRAFLGSVNFLQKFLPNIQAKCADEMTNQIKKIKDALADARVNCRLFVMHVSEESALFYYKKHTKKCIDQ
ncbi:hypothetical protein ACOME3_007608 [Neoechinorhynchus agilis]